MICFRLLVAGVATAAVFGVQGTARAETSIEADFARPTKAGANLVGLNVCWLLDSDRLPHAGRSTSDALVELHPGALRFPYGHLADNYLWHTPVDAVPQSGELHPRVASLREAPGGWSWAVKPDGSMPEAMGFDEFLRLCAKTGANPVVCVNVLSYKYPGGPSYEALKASAVAWVRYAARQRLRVAYWEIGNEVDLKPNARLVPLEDYVNLYADFARAMKTADPAARIGPGISNNEKYYRALMQRCPDLIDFAVVHQYEWSQKQCATYAGWRDSDATFIPNLERASRALAVPGRPAVKLMVTETGVAGGAALGEKANTYKALWLGELLLNELADPAVAYPMFWGTHTPWNFQGYDREPTRDVSLALRLRTNALTPMGEVVKLINDNALADFVVVPRVSGRLRAYGMRASDGTAAALFLLNKDDRPLALHVRLHHADGMEVAGCQELVGRSPDDPAPRLRDRSLPGAPDGELDLTLSPLSLTVVRLRDAGARRSTRATE